MKNLNLRKYLNIQFILLCITFYVLGVFLSYNSKNLTPYESSMETAQITYINGYDVKDNYFIPINDDPSIGFINLNKKLSAIFINLKNPLKTNTIIQVYYATKNEPLSETNSYKIELLKGKTKIILPLAEQIYTELRLDINGEFELDNIKIGKPILNNKLEMQDFFYALIIMCLLIGFTIFIKKYFKLLFSQLIDTFKEKNTLDKIIMIISILGFFLWFVMFLISLLSFQEFTFKWYLSFLIGTFVELIFMIYCMRSIIFKKIELLFAISFILLGTWLTVALPLGEVSWDDGIHYARVLDIGSNDVNFSEYKLRNIYVRPNPNGNVNVIKKINLADSDISIPIPKNELTWYQKIPYIPSAMFIFIGKLLGVPIHTTYYMGRMAMIFLYVYLIYHAIKNLKSGKVLLSIIALVPTNLFLAASYSYDVWVTGFAMLGFSYILKELQEPDKSVSMEDMIKMLLSFLLMGGAKAIYFPLVLMAFFIKKDKFKSQNYRKYCFFILGIMIIMFLSYCIPMFMTHSQSITDLRGGTEVNGGEQIKFILQHPIQYTGILLNFFKDYLSISNITNYINNFAYLGLGIKSELLLVLLGVVSFTDKNDFDKNITWKTRILTIPICFITTVLVATALYVTFTPVASANIAGCQPRYLMPMLFPILYMLGSWKIKNEMNQACYISICYTVLLFIIFNDFIFIFTKIL